MPSSTRSLSDDGREHDLVKRGELEAEAGPGVRGDASILDKVVLDKETRPENLEIRGAENHGKQAATPDTPLEEDVPPEKKRSKALTALIMLALGMAVFLAALDTTIITTALPTICEHFNSSVGYTWIGSGYLLASAATTPVWGKVSDIFGRKGVLLLANVIFCVGSLLAAVSVNISMLIAARAIQGVGGGGLIVLVNITISDLFSMRSRGAFFGVIGGVWALASATGPLIGGAFTQKVSWRWCFYINLPLDGCAFAIIFFFLDVHNPRTPLWEGLKAIDWLGSLTVVGGTLMFLLGLQFGGVSFPWASATVVCLIVFGVLIWGIFILIEWKLAPYPIMPLKIFKFRSNIAALGTVFAHGFVFIGSAFYLPLFFQASIGATPILSGVYTLASSLSLSFVSAFTGIFIRKTGEYLPPIWFGMTLMTLGYGLFIDLSAHSSWAKIVLYQIVAGIGVGPNFQSPLIALQTLVHPSDVASATATFAFTRNIATAVSIVIGGVVFQNEMDKRYGTLLAALGPKNADMLRGGSAGAKVGFVNALPPAQRAVARDTFAASMRAMWITYTVFAGIGLLVSLCITKQKLTREHQETKTGLEVEKEKRRILEEERKKKHSKTDAIEEKV